MVFLNWYLVDYPYKPPQLGNFITTLQYSGSLPDSARWKEDRATGRHSRNRWTLPLTENYLDSIERELRGGYKRTMWTLVDSPVYAKQQVWWSYCGITRVVCLLSGGGRVVGQCTVHATGCKLKDWGNQGNKPGIEDQAFGAVYVHKIPIYR